MKTLTTTRGYLDQSGKRTTLRFEPETWAAIDQIAASRGTTWSAWVSGIPANHDNRHTDVRVAVVQALRKIKAVEFQAGELHIDAPALRDAFTVTDAELRADLSSNDSFIDDGSAMDFGGFLIRSGTRQGVLCLWIQNGLRDGVHLVVPTPAWNSAVAVQTEDAA